MYDNRNYNVTQSIGRTLDDHKNFITAYGNPRKGVIILRYHDSFDDKDHDFILEITPVDDQCEKFRDTVDKLHYLFR